MKPLAIKTLFFALILTVCAASLSFAQNAKLQLDQIERLFPKAAETIDVRVDGSLLQIASKFLKSDKADEAAAREVIQALKGVYVKGVEFDREGEYTEADVEAVRSQLSAPGWERIVGVRSRREGQNVEVFLMINNAVIDGIGVLVFEPKQLLVVNVVGPIDPEKITQLRGQFGIPGDLELDFGGSKRRNRQN